MIYFVGGTTVNSPCGSGFARTGPLISVSGFLEVGSQGGGQTMTEAEHNWPILKLFDNRPSALAAEVFCETIRPIVSQKKQVICTQNIPIIVSFSLLLS